MNRKGMEMTSPKASRQRVGMVAATVENEQVNSANYNPWLDQREDDKRRFETEDSQNNEQDEEQEGEGFSNGRRRV
jgi:hypothetical protein